MVRIIQFNKFEDIEGVSHSQEVKDKLTRLNTEQKRALLGIFQAPQFNETISVLCSMSRELIDETITQLINSKPKKIVNEDSTMLLDQPSDQYLWIAGLIIGSIYQKEQRKCEEENSKRLANMPNNLDEYYGY